MNTIVKAALEGFLTPFRMVQDIITKRELMLMEPVKIGYVDECEMHGNVFSKIDELRDGLERLATHTAKVVKFNRLYLSGGDIQLNITIDREMYLITADDEGYEVSKRNKKTSQAEKHRVGYESIRDGSFLELFQSNIGP